MSPGLLSSKYRRAVAGPRGAVVVGQPGATFESLCMTLEARGFAPHYSDAKWSSVRDQAAMTAMCAVLDRLRGYTVGALIMSDALESPARELAMVEAHCRLVESLPSGLARRWYRHHDGSIALDASFITWPEASYEATRTALQRFFGSLAGRG